MAKMPKKKTLKTKLDKLARSYCKERANHECEAKGYRSADSISPHPCSGRLEWCHIHGRRVLATRWSSNNCTALCTSHHFRFTEHPTEFTLFLNDRFPERVTKADEESRIIMPVKQHQMLDYHEKIKESMENWEHYSVLDIE